MKIKRCAAMALVFLFILTSCAFADIIDETGGTPADPSEVSESLKACYVIEAPESGGYDADAKTQIYEVYLDSYDCALYTGTFGMSYDAGLQLSFELDKENFAYFQRFDTKGSDIVFQWIKTKDFKKPEDKEDMSNLWDNFKSGARRLSRSARVSVDRIHLGTIKIDNVIMSTAIPPYPIGWHTKTIHQLDWLTTDISREPKYTNNADGICLNDEIWRALIIPEPPAEPEPEPVPDPDTPAAQDDTEGETDGTEVTEPTEPEGPSDVLAEFDLAKQVEGYYQGYDMTDEDNSVWIDIGFLWNSSYKLPEKTGRVIKGTVNAYNPKNPLEVALYFKGADASVAGMQQPVYRIENPDGRVTGDYEVNIDSPGDYVLEIKKSAHLTYYLDITVPEGDEDVEAQEVTLFCGDISGDEKIKLNDRTTLMKYLNAQLHTGADEDRAEALRSDLNGDGKVTIHDLNILKKYYNRTYKEAVSNGA